MKELAVQSPQAYWDVMNHWQLNSASQITNPESQEKIREEIIKRMVERSSENSAA